MGSMEHLSEATLEDVANFFRTYYTPDNAVLSIVGDVSVGEARRLVDEHFGAIPRGGARPALPDMSLPPTFGAWRREVVADEVMVPRLFLAMRSPVLGSDEYYAASVAGAVLGMSRGSRLYRRLVRERQVATEVAAFTFDLAKGSDLLIVDATARPEVSGEALEETVGECLDALHEAGVTADEVARAIALITTDLVTSLQSAQSRAAKLSQFATYFGDPSLVNSQVERFQRVTVAEVNRVARERLGRDIRASLLYVPRNNADGGGAPAPADMGEEG
jgi:predicted Zn-dependent peptidase